MEEPEILYVVLYRNSPTSRWQAISEGELPCRRMALNLIECKKAAGWKTQEFAIIGGAVHTEKDLAEQEAELSTF
jgi:hypothetical protein